MNFFRAQILSVRSYIVVVVSLGIMAFPQILRADDKIWTDPATGFALAGYDVVSFWSPNGPVVGTGEFEIQVNGINWRFSNQGNREEFLKFPKVYTPQFSGYGAYAIAQGSVPRGNPKIWALAKNKLYFFFSLDARKKWLRASDRNIRKAEKKWPVLQGEIAHLD